MVYRISGWVVEFIPLNDVPVSAIVSSTSSLVQVTALGNFSLRKGSAISANNISSGSI